MYSSKKKFQISNFRSGPRHLSRSLQQARTRAHTERFVVSNFLIENLTLKFNSFGNGDLINWPHMLGLPCRRAGIEPLTFHWLAIVICATFHDKSTMRGTRVLFEKRCYQFLGRELYLFVIFYTVAVVLIVLMFELCMPVLFNPNYPNPPDDSPPNIWPTFKWGFWSLTWNSRNTIIFFYTSILPYSIRDIFTHFYPTGILDFDNKKNFSSCEF